MGLPGGLMELGESPEETACREVYEETGIEVKNLQLINVFSGANYFTKLANGDEFQSVTTAYYTDEYDGDFVMNKEEAVQLTFFPLTELPDYIVGSHKKMIAEYMKIMEKRYNNSERNTKTQYWLVVQTHDFMSVTFPGCPVFLIFKGGAVNGFDSISRWSIFVGIITCKEKGSCMEQGISLERNLQTKKCLSL